VGDEAIVVRGPGEEDAMTIEQRMQDGDFEGALALLHEQTAGPRPDPGQLLMVFNLEVRLQRFAAAEQSIRRLIEVAPEVAAPMTAFARNARAEAAATTRMTDVATASRRAGIGAPPPHALAFVKAAVRHAQRDHAGAVAALAEARAITPASPGTLTWRNGRTARFADLMDSDDLTGPVLPCYDGETVLDLAYSQLRSVTFRDARTSFDTMWIPSDIVLATGEPVMVKVPAFHVGTGVAEEPTARTGQTTLWDHAHGYAQAIGQRDLKLINADGGMSMVGILQVRQIELDPPAAPSAGAGVERPKGFWKRLFS
jgi:protein involved in temperature-dependent protein secretion